jgi:glycosyltransferase involved in cell wall biosynthesis
MDKLLTIAIPTFNRAHRLEKSLNDLLSHIVKSEKKRYISVFVSNNGSTDSTTKIIDKYREIFRQSGIPFGNFNFEENRGFDANVLNCYRKSDSDYVWFLSDDDNIITDAIDLIIDDIQKYAPNVLYFNFDQPPYTLSSPLNKTTSLFKSIDLNNIQSISKIISWPKLTALVIKKNNGEAGEKIKHLDHHFMHVALAIQTALDYGMVLHSDKVIACPDVDYLDCIDFPPYIVNYLDKTVEMVLCQNRRSDMYQQIKIERVDPLTSSMKTLELYYMGRNVLTSDLKTKLYSTVMNELKQLKFSKIKFAVLKRFVKLFLSYLYNVCHIVFTGKRATRLRKINENA